MIGLVPAVLLYLLYRRYLTTESGRVALDELKLRLPLVGRLVRGFNAARFTRTLSILSASSVPVLEGMRIAGEVVTNLPMREAVGEAAAQRLGRFVEQQIHRFAGQQ